MFNTVMLELTYRCNLACSFCYLRHCGRLNGAGAELSAGQLKKIIRRFRPGTDFYLTGGEPLLRGDLLEIAAFIKRSGSRFGISTNGTLLSGDMLKGVAALSPEYVMLSLHGPEALHDKLSGKKGAWRALVRNMAAFSRLAGPGTEIMVNCVVCRENAGSLAAVYRIAAKSGAHRVLFSHLQFLKPGEASGLKGRLAAGGVVTPEPENYALDTGQAAAQLGRIFTMPPGGPHFEERPRLDEAGLEQYYNGRLRPLGTCPKAMSSLNVEPDGKVRLCVSYGLAIGDAVKTGLRAMREKKNKILGGALPAGCARCCQRFGIFRHF